MTLDKKAVADIFERLLMEFPMRMINIDIPKWMQALPADSEIITYALDKVTQAAGSAMKMSDYKNVEMAVADGVTFTEAQSVNLDMAEGAATLGFGVSDGLFYEVLSKECGENIGGEFELLSYVRELKAAKDGYDGIKSALECSLATGYGIVPADLGAAEIGSPRVVKKNGQYCVKIGVDAKSLHLIKADVHTDVEVVSGSKEQCDGFAAQIADGGGAGLDMKVFGRPVTSILEENVTTKSSSMPENVRMKLKRTVNKAVNEKKSNLICLLI